MPFIAYLSQTLNKNNKHTISRPHACLRYEDQHTPTLRTKALKCLQGVCILIKQDARVHYPTINIQRLLSAGQPAQPHPVPYRAPSGEGGKRQPLSSCISRVCDSSGPNSVSRPDQHQETSGSTPTSEEESSTEKHTRQPAGVSSTIPLASSTITTQPCVA